MDNCWALVMGYFYLNNFCGFHFLGIEYDGYNDINVVDLSIKNVWDNRRNVFYNHT